MPYISQICTIVSLQESENFYLLGQQYDLQVSLWILTNWWPNFTDGLFAKYGKTWVHAKYNTLKMKRKKNGKVLFNKLLTQCLHKRHFRDISNLLGINLIQQWILRHTSQRKIPKIGIALLSAFNFTEKSSLWRLIICNWSYKCIPLIVKGQTSQRNH